MTRTISPSLAKVQELVSHRYGPGQILILLTFIPLVATTLHLYSKEPLFNRAIATGGSALLVPVFELTDQERTYQQVLSILGLENLDVDARIQQLLTLPTDEVIAKLPPSVPILPTIDGDVIPVRPTFSSVSDKADQSMPGKQWADGLAIGNSEFDVGSNPSKSLYLLLTGPGFGACNHAWTFEKRHQGEVPCVHQIIPVLGSSSRRANPGGVRLHGLVSG